MSKFLRKFSTHSEYEAFTASTEFIKPNISYCLTEGHIHFNPIVKASGVTLDTNSMTIKVGETSGLTATVLPEDTTDKSVTWSSSNNSIATVDANGVVSGIAVGNVTITVTTVDGGFTATCTVTVNPPPPTTGDYLTFVAEEAGTFSFSKSAVTGDIQYSKNGGSWIQGRTVTVANGDVVKWKGEMTPGWMNDNLGVGQFSSSGNFSVGGTPMSLLFGDNYSGQTSFYGKNHTFQNLFRGCAKLTSIDYLSLPATTLAGHCYCDMFNGCTSLTTVPSDLLPATTLPESCYSSMFEGCSSLTTAPDLPAPTLTGGCYYEMFSGCTSLNYIKCLATNITSIYCTPNWVKNVAASGTFVKAASMTSWKRGTNGIPRDWTVQDA